MYQRILVGVDNSEASRAALAHAVALAAAQRAQLRAVHVAEEIPGGLFDYPSTVIADVRRAAEEEGDRVLARAQDAARQAGVDVETRLLRIVSPYPRIARLLVNEAQDWAADLIVLGTHGRRGLDRLLLGSVAEGVSRLATVPVLLVRQPPAKSAAKSVGLRDLPLIPD